MGTLPIRCARARKMYQVIVRSSSLPVRAGWGSGLVSLIEPPPKGGLVVDGSSGCRTMGPLMWSSSSSNLSAGVFCAQSRATGACIPPASWIGCVGSAGTWGPVVVPWEEAGGLSTWLPAAASRLVSALVRGRFWGRSERLDDPASLGRCVRLGRLGMALS
eukprot:scaffold573_cov183-Pinguiococcus_pyrenoidosus.AAC.2